MNLSDYSKRKGKAWSTGGVKFSSNPSIIIGIMAYISQLPFTYKMKDNGFDRKFTHLHLKLPAFPLL